MSDLKEYQNIEVNSFEVQDMQPSPQSVRVIQEVQGQIIMAKKFPRNENKAIEKILSSCKRKKLAESAEYAFPKGGKTVFGASIRLAEVLAQNWQNLSYGTQIIEQSDENTTVESYCWDLETNVRVSKVFKIKHERKARGKINKVTDPDDVYQLVANYGSRRTRACILGIIPKDVVELAEEQCKLTLSGQSNEPFEDRLRKMCGIFKDKYSVSVEMLQKYKNKEIGEFTADDVYEMLTVYNSIKEGHTKVKDWFGGKKEEKSEKSQSIEQSILGGFNTTSEEKPSEIRENSRENEDKKRIEPKQQTENKNKNKPKSPKDIKFSIDGGAK